MPVIVTHSRYWSFTLSTFALLTASCKTRANAFSVFNSLMSGLDNAAHTFFTHNNSKTQPLRRLWSQRERPLSSLIPSCSALSGSG